MDEVSFEKQSRAKKKKIFINSPAVLIFDNSSLISLSLSTLLALLLLLFFFGFPCLGAGVLAPLRIGRVRFCLSHYGGKRGFFLEKSKGRKGWFACCYLRGWYSRLRKKRKLCRRKKKNPAMEHTEFRKSLHLGLRKKFFTMYWTAKLNHLIFSLQDSSRRIRTFKMYLNPTPALIKISKKWFWLCVDFPSHCLQDSWQYLWHITAYFSNFGPSPGKRPEKCNLETEPPKGCS